MRSSLQMYLSSSLLSSNLRHAARTSGHVSPFWCRCMRSSGIGEAHESEGGSRKATARARRGEWHWQNRVWQVEVFAHVFGRTEYLAYMKHFEDLRAKNKLDKTNKTLGSKLEIMFTCLPRKASMASCYILRAPTQWMVSNIASKRERGTPLTRISAFATNNFMLSNYDVYRLLKFKSRVMHYILILHIILHVS